VLHVSLRLGVIETSSDQTLSGIQSMFGVLHRLAFGNITDMASAVFGKGYDRWGCSLTFGVLNNLGVTRLKDGNARIGRSKIDSNNRCESSLLRRCLLNQAGA